MKVRWKGEQGGGIKEDEKVRRREGRRGEGTGEREER